MNRQDLIELVRIQEPRHVRRLLWAVVFSVLWMVLLFLFGGPIIDELGPIVIIPGAAVPVIVFLAVGFKNLSELPRCPHCGVMFFRWLLAAAISSGHCGRCGRNLDE